MKILIHSSPEKIFDFKDNIGNIGMYMTKNSMPMIGTKLELNQLSESPTGLNFKFRWTGIMISFSTDFTVVVAKWTKCNEKIGKSLIYAIK
jgi:hypothetical protein